MRKRDELVSGCMSRAGDEEMTFVLLSRDPAAPDTIRTWGFNRINLGKNAADDPQITEALECAATMEREGALHKPASRAAEAAADTGRAQDQRVEFEAWAKDAGFNTWNDTGYSNMAVALAWEAWQQARKAQEPRVHYGPCPKCGGGVWAHERPHTMPTWPCKCGTAGALEWRDRKAQVGDLTFEVARLYGHWYVIVNAPDDLYAMEGVMLRVQTSEQAPDAPAVEARLRAFFAAGLAALSGDGARQGEEGASDE